MPFFKRKDKPGEYKGRHYTEYVDQVTELKRQGKLDEAEALLLALIDATEAEAKAEKTIVAPWYYEHLAIVYRTQKDYASEVSVLERYSKQPRGQKEKLLERLKKARALRDGKNYGRE